MRDQFSEIQPLPCISPQIETGNNAMFGAIVDRQGFDALTYVIATGTLADADATFAVLLEHGDDAALSDAAAVPDAQMNGTEALAGFAFGDDDATRKIGYIGDKRYTRLTITPSANSGNAPIAAVAVLGRPNTAPTANPPS